MLYARLTTVWDDGKPDPGHKCEVSVVPWLNESDFMMVGEAVWRTLCRRNWSQQFPGGALRSGVSVLVEIRDVPQELVEATTPEQIAEAKAAK